MYGAREIRGKFTLARCAGASSNSGGTKTPRGDHVVRAVTRAQSCLQKLAAVPFGQAHSSALPAKEGFLSTSPRSRYAATPVSAFGRRQHTVHRHARACPAHPRLWEDSKTWVAGTSPAKTKAANSPSASR